MATDFGRFHKLLNSKKLETVSRGQVKYLDFAENPSRAIGALSLGLDFVVIIASVQMAILAFVPTKACNVIGFDAAGADGKDHIEVMMEQISQHWERGSYLGYFDQPLENVKAFVVGALAGGDDPNPKQSGAIMDHLTSLGLKPRLEFFGTPRAEHASDRGTIFVTCPDDRPPDVFIDGYWK
jgi:hypothetical protein